MTRTALVTATFNNLTAFNIKSAEGITGLEGGVLYAQNLKYFAATNCNIYDVLLEDGSGDAIFLVNYVGPTFEVLLQNNTLSSLTSPIS